MTITCDGQYCQSGTPDYFWGSLTLLLVFLPGAQLYSFKNEWVKENWRWRWRFACLVFPLTLVFFKAALVLNPSPRMMGMNIRMTACEATLESLLQLSLQLYIIFLRSDTMPSLLQVGGLNFQMPSLGK